MSNIIDSFNKWQKDDIDRLQSINKKQKRNSNIFWGVFYFIIFILFFYLVI